MKVLKITTIENEVIFIRVDKIDAIALVHSLEFGDNNLRIYSNGSPIYMEKLELIKDLEVFDSPEPIYLIVSKLNELKQKMKT